MNRVERRSKVRRAGHRRDTGLIISVWGGSKALSDAVYTVAMRTLAQRYRRRGQLDVVIVGDAAMRRLHARWFGKGSSTDVLTFDLRESREARTLDAEIFVCRSIARRRARVRRTDWKAELLLYVVHGCLHLCGFDDHDDSDATRMHKEEDHILMSLGWGPVYSGRELPPTSRV